MQTRTANDEENGIAIGRDLILNGSPSIIGAISKRRLARIARSGAKLAGWSATATALGPIGVQNIMRTTILTCHINGNITPTIKSVSDRKSTRLNSSH